MSAEPGKNHGENIGNIVRSALSSGDLSRLKDLGPAVQDAVKDNIPNITIETRGTGNKPAVPNNRQTPAGEQNGQPNYTQPNAPGYQKLKWPYDTRQYHQPKPPAQPRGSLNIPKGIFRIVFGVIGMVAFGLCAAVFGGISLFMPLQEMFWPLFAASGVAFGGCALLTGSGVATNKLANRAQRYYAQLEKKPVLTLEEMAAEAGRTPKQIKKDFRKMREKGWLADVRMDAGETCLMRGEDTYQQYMDSKKTQKEREEEEERRKQLLSNPETATLEHFRSQGVETIRKIRSANEAIPGEEISGKLSRLEATCARIFSYVEAHPDKLPETSKFMDYYLPTTLKLVEKYRQYEQMDFQPDNVKETKAQIEDALDNIDSAFKNLLESLYQEDTIDVATDIVVLEKMLEQEGLSGKKFEISESDGEDPIKLTIDSK